MSINPTFNTRASQSLSAKRGVSFAVTLPLLMALLLGCVPFLGTNAKALFLLTLVPLILWAAFTNPERALYLYVAWCWMDGVIRGVFDLSPVSVIARDLIMGVITAGWAMQRLQTRASDPVRWPPGSVLVALFAADCLLQVFNPYSLGLLTSLAGLKLHLLTIPLLFLGYDTFRRPEQVRAMFLFLTLATLVVGLLSLLQYVEGRDWTWAHYPGTKAVISQVVHVTQAGDTLSDSASFKPPGATGFGGNTGAFIGLLFPVAFVLPLLSQRPEQSILSRAAWLPLLPALIVIMLINGVRSALMMALTGALLTTFLMGGSLRRRVLPALAVCVVLGAAAWPVAENLTQGGAADRFSSTFANPVQALHQDRRTFFDDAVAISLRSPLGVGLGRVGPAAGRFGSAGDSLGFAVFSEAYLGSMLYETGLLGGLLIVSIAVLFLVRGWLGLRRLRDPDDRLMAAALLALLGVVFVNFFLTPILIAPPGSVLFWLLGGVLLRVYGQKEERG